MNAVKKHAVLTAVAMAVGIGVVFWLRPTTSGGTIFIVAVSARLGLLSHVTGGVGLPETLGIRIPWTPGTREIPN